MRKVLSFCLALWLSVSPFLNGLLASALAAPTVGTPLVSPSAVPAGIATPVTVTSQIISGPGDPPVLPTGVNLLQVDAQDRVLAILGAMRDDGTGGDAVAGNGVFTLRITVNQAAAGDIRLRVSAPFRGRAQRVLSPVAAIPVQIAQNQPPGFTSSPPTLGAVGVLYSYQATAIDPEGGALSFQLISGPSGMLVEQGGLVQWTPTLGQVGNQGVEIKVFDAQGAGTSQTFTIGVAPPNQPPIITSSPNTTATEASAYQYQVAAQDPEGGQLSFQLVSGPSGMTIGQSTGLVQWTPTKAQVGDQSVQLQASDSQGAPAVQSFTIHVAALNQPPVISSVPTTTATTTLLYSYQVAAQDPEGGGLTYQLVTSPTGMTMAPTTGLVQWTPTAAQIGNQNVQLKVVDAQAAETPQNFTIAVSELNLAPVITSVPTTFAKTTEPYTYNVTAYDPEKKTVQFSFSEPQPTGMTIDAATGAVRWSPTNSQIGNVRVAVRATDPAGAYDTQAFNLKVFDPTNDLQIISPTGAQSIRIAQTLTLPLQANYTGAVFSVNPALTNGSIAGTNFTFKPTSNQEGVQTVTFKATYGDMQKSVVIPITVTRDNSSPVIAPVGQQTVQEGSSLNFTISATDADNDPLTYSAPGLNLANAFFNAFSRQFTFNPVVGQAGDYQVVFSVSDTRVTTQMTVPIKVTKSTGQQQVLDLVVDPVSNPTLQGSATISGNVTGQPGTPQPKQTPPLVTGLVPSGAKQGQTLTVQITGLNSNFGQTTSRADFGSGITVNSLTVTSTTNAQANITIDKLASLGVRTVRMIGAGTEAQSVVAFNVEKGVASITGTVIDPFTNQPLVNATVTINGTTISALTDSQGRFTLTDVPTGSVPLIITLPNYNVRQVSISVGVSDAVDLGAPIQLNALARPPNFKGSIPRAATVASVLDRGVSTQGGGFTLDQAKAVISDTLIAVGGIEAGVLDDGGNQLNPKIDGKGDWSLTQQGVERHALGLIQGDVYTVKDLVFMLQGTFSFPLGLSMNDVISGFQQAANEAWANPADPQSAMAIVLFNVGTTLSSRPPTITPDTRLNRFQLFLLTSSFIVYNGARLGRAVEDTLNANGIEFKSVLGSFGLSKAPTLNENRFAAIDWLRAAFSSIREWLLPSAYGALAGDCPPNPAFPCTGADLLNRKTFSKVWRNVGANAISDAVHAAVVGAMIAAAQQFFLVTTLGVTGGPAGVVIGLTIAAAAVQGALASVLYKLLFIRLIAQAAASLDPGPPLTLNAVKQPDGSYVLPFSRSESELAEIPRAATSVKKFVYHLYRFPDCIDGDWQRGAYVEVQAQADPTDAANNNSPPSGRLRFVIPASQLTDGKNCFRIVTFQTIASSITELEESLTKYDTDQDGMLSLDEFRRAGLGGILVFNGKDRNADGKLDASEFQIKSQVPRDLNVPGANFSSPSLQNYATTRTTPAQAQAELSQASAALEGKIQGDIRSAHVQLNELYLSAGPIQDELDFLANHKSSFDLADDVSQRAKGLSDELAKMTLADAKVRIQQEALSIANEVYAKYAPEIVPGGNQVDKIAEVLEIHRSARSLRLGFDNALSEGQNLLDVIAQAKAGNVPAEGVKVPLTVLYEDEGGILTNRPAYAPGVTVTRENAADLESYLTVKGAAPFTSPIRQFNTFFTEFSAQLGPGAIADVDVPVPGGNTVGSKEYDLLADTIVTRSPGQLTLDEAYGLIEGPNHQARVQQFEGEFVAKGQKIQSVVSDLQTLDAGLLKARGLYPNLESGDALSSRVAPKIERPPGLSQFFEKGVNGPVGFLGSFLGGTSQLALFYQNVKILSSVPSDCYTVVKSPGGVTPGNFPPSIEPNTSGYEVGSVLRAQNDPKNAKGGFLARDYPGSDERVTLAETGFPPGFIADDSRGRIYAINLNSTDQYGGRIFRYSVVPTTPGPITAPQPYGLKREFVGSINYYSLDLQYARPANPVAMVVGPKFSANFYYGGPGYTSDLFIADVDAISGDKRIVQVSTSLIDTNSFYNLESNRNRLVGQTVLVNNDFRFTGPSDMEVGCDLAFPDPTRTADSVLLLSDENVIWAIFKPGPGASLTAYKIMEIPGRRWSGLAFDNKGKFYFADYANREIFITDWPHLRTIINSSSGSGHPVIQSNNSLYNSAFLMARTKDAPGDIEVEGPSSHAGGVLFVSKRPDAVDPVMMPLVGNLGANVRDLKIVRFSKEDDVAIEVTPSGSRVYRAVPTHEDLNLRKLTLRIKRVDDQGNESWQEQPVFLSDNGATILDMLQ